MLNKLYKTIHNKYSSFFNFIFFLRYLLLIFVISIALFLNIPKFFNYEKRTKVINDFLFTNYNYKIASFDEVDFIALPIPKLEFKNVEINHVNSSQPFFVRSLRIHPRLFSIYNFENYQANKIVFKDNNIVLKASALNSFIKELFNQKKKLIFDKTKIQVIEEKKLILKLIDVKFANYGYSKNIITGKIFEKKFKIEINNNNKNIKFNLFNSGISADINFDINQQPDTKSGVFRAKILNSNLKLNFNYNKKLLKIYNSYFRHKNLSFNNDVTIVLDPFSEINSILEINEFNTDIIKKINFDRLLKEKDLIKKINIKNTINFKSKKFTRSLIDELNLQVDLAYGRVNYKKKFLISDSVLKCDGSINILEEYPLIFFSCSISSDSKKNFLKKFEIKIKEKDKKFNLNFEGNLNVLNKKINFENVLLNESYIASKEDLSYYKISFEKILFNKNFIEIFDLKKIKKFILEIS